MIRPAPGHRETDLLNQSGDLPEFNAFRDDRALAAAMTVFGAAPHADRLEALGRIIGSHDIEILARDANRHPPEFRPFDRFGNRIDEIEFHPSWHRLMGIARGSGTHALPWTDAEPGAHAARAGLSYLLNQGENGVCCPITMTFASAAALRHAPDILRTLGARIFGEGHDPRPLPPAQKSALSVGMAMTERQGGSDLRQTLTRSSRGAGDHWYLNGEKWFFSVPQSDLILTLAQTQSGISCFLAHGWREDGSRNGLEIRRLKDKCGNRSNAAAEVAFIELEAVMVGEEGRGIATLIGMAHLTRFDCAVSAAAIMRKALTQAIHHCRNRRAFQRRLVDQPLMENLLADLALDAEAFMWAVMRLGQSLDHPQDEAEVLLGRIAIPVMKYLACKRTPGFVAEALECHGGNGFVEDHPMARLYREAPLNGIWEGSGNVICLDVLRSASRAPQTIAAFLAETGKAQGMNADFDRALVQLKDLLRDPAGAEYRARHLVERMGLLFQAGLLLRHSTEDVATAFCAARLGADRGRDYGAFPVPGTSASRQGIIARAGL